MGINEISQFRPFITLWWSYVWSWSWIDILKRIVHELNHLYKLHVSLRYCVFKCLGHGYHFFFNAKKLKMYSQIVFYDVKLLNKTHKSHPWNRTIKVQYIKGWPIDVGRNYSNVATNIIKNNKHFSKRFFCLGLNFEMVFLLGCDSYKEGHVAFLTTMFMLLSCLRQDLHLFAFMDYYCIVHGKGHSMVVNMGRPWNKLLCKLMYPHSNIYFKQGLLEHDSR